jgi:hypothetical protein
MTTIHDADSLRGTSCHLPQSMGSIGFQIPSDAIPIDPVSGIEGHDKYSTTMYLVFNFLHTSVDYSHLHQVYLVCHKVRPFSILGSGLIRSR